MLFGKTGERVYLSTIGNVVDGETARDNDDPSTRFQRAQETSTSAPTPVRSWASRASTAAG